MRLTAPRGGSRCPRHAFACARWRRCRPRFAAAPWTALGRSLAIRKMRRLRALRCRKWLTVGRLADEDGGGGGAGGSVRGGGWAGRRSGVVVASAHAFVGMERVCAGAGGGWCVAVG